MNKEVPFTTAIKFDLNLPSQDSDMDNSSHIKKLFSDLMDARDVKMCQIYNERTGSILFKIRFDAEECDQSGGGTQNSNIYFKRKSNKQVKRDIARSQDKNQTENVSSRTRSQVPQIESFRCDISSLDHSTNAASPINLSEVASPVICSNSPEVDQYCVPIDSPEPVMHACDDQTQAMHSREAADREHHRAESLPTEPPLDGNACEVALPDEVIGTSSLSTCDREITQSSHSPQESVNEESSDSDYGPHLSTFSFKNFEELSRYMRQPFNDSKNTSETDVSSDSDT